MKHFLFLAFLSLIFFESCDKPSVSTTYVNPEMKDYFVNYDTGTCWVYQDTFQNNRFDTIKLVQNFDNVTYVAEEINEEEIMLHYKPGKTRDFYVYVKPDVAQIDTIEFHSVSIGVYRISDGKWSGADYKDSLKIGKKTFKDVLVVHGSCKYFSDFIYAKGVGLVSYISTGIKKEAGGNYILINKFKK